MMRILVTGAGGQLGRSLKQQAGAQTELEIDFLDRSGLDITQPSSVKKALGQGYAVCINCAAYTDVEGAEKDQAEAMAINRDGVRNLAEACREAGVTLVHISTDYVFDGEKQGPYLPSDRPNPINAYGRSKLAGEAAIQELLEKFYIVRTSWLYSREGKNFYTNILAKARAGIPLTVTDEQTGCPTEAKNLAAFLYRLIRSDLPPGIYHYTDGEAMSWYDFAVRILKENHLNPEDLPLKTGNYRTFARRPKNSILKSTTNL